MINKWYVLLIVLACISFSKITYADQVDADDVIIQGSQCVGQDCSNGEVFSADTWKLKENNTRIRFLDISAPDVLGQSWNITANDSSNGGDSYFQFKLKSLNLDALVMSDGTAPLYDCSVPVPLATGGLPPIIGVIAAGEPVTTPQNGVFDGVSAYVYECLTVEAYTEKPILTLGTFSDSSVTLGYDSVTETGQISVGNTNLLRNLKHVAAGISNTDLLIKQALDESTSLQDQQDSITTLQGQLAALASQISDIEDKVYNNAAPTEPDLVAPNKKAVNVSSPVTLMWNESTDLDGDALRYSVTVCDNQDFTGCTSEVVAVNQLSMVLAGLGGGTGLLLWAGLVGQGRSRKQRWVAMICLISASLLTASCRSGDSSDYSHEVSGLTAGTQYYWKVTATDFIDSTDSEVRRFTTQ